MNKKIIYLLLFSLLTVGSMCIEEPAPETNATTTTQRGLDTTSTTQANISSLFDNPDDITPPLPPT